MESHFVFPNTKSRESFAISEELILKCIELDEVYVLEQTGKREDPIVAGTCARAWERNAEACNVAFVRRGCC